MNKTKQEVETVEIGVLVPVSTTELIFDEDHKFFFVDKDNMCRIVIDKGSKQVPVFITHKHKQICVQRFLAFHSSDIAKYLDEQDKQTEGTSKVFLDLSFSNDMEIIDSFKDCNKYKDRIQWTLINNVTENDVMQEELKNFATLKNPLVGVKIQSIDVEYLIVNIFELYVNVMMPWNLKNKYGQNMVVFMSILQKDFYEKNRNDCDFAIAKSGALELRIINKEKKEQLAMKLTDNVLNFHQKKNIELFTSPSKALVLEFNNGDRDILSALSGAINYQFFREIEKSELNEFCQEKVKDMTKTIVLIVHNEQTEYIITSLK